MRITLVLALTTALVSAQEILSDPKPVKAAPVPVEPAKPVMKVTPPQPKAEQRLPLGSREAADALTDDELRKVVDMLRENYIRPDVLSEQALARSNVQGVLDRLGAGARIYAKRAAESDQPSPFRSEVLDGGVSYIRLGALTLENIAAMDKSFDDFSTKPPTALVLDLRATPHSTDFDLAAEVTRRFSPKGRVLFSIKRPKVNDEEILTSREDPRWRGVLVVLVDGDTAGAGEVIAAVLRTHVRAYIVGQQTQGEAAQFEELPLPSGKVLRVAVGEVTLPDNSPVFPGGLTPDLPIALPQEKTDAILVSALTAGAASLVADKERPRMNEAALVAGTNPEFDAMQEQQKLKAKGPLPPPPPRDIVLQRALDYITGVRIFEASQAKKR